MRMRRAISCLFKLQCSNESFLHSDDCSVASKVSVCDVVHFRAAQDNIFEVLLLLKITEKWVIILYITFLEYSISSQIKATTLLSMEHFMYFITFRCTMKELALKLPFLFRIKIYV